MPGVLVHDQVFPCDSHLLSPLFVENNAVGSHPFSHSEESLRVSSPLQSFPSDLCTDDCRSSSFKSSQNQLSLSALHGFECFGSSPSPPDRVSPKIAMFDAREELGRKLFSRSLSKLGGQGLLAVNEDIHLEELSGYERAMSEAGADVYSSLGLSPGDLKDLAGGMAIPIRGSYVNTCGTPFGSPSLLPDAIGALQKYLPSNNEDDESWLPHADSWSVGDVYSCDEFRMYEFKVRKCMRGRSHDWTECPFAHPGEKARRRDPRKFHYSGTACPDFRKGSCRRGDACEYAHGVFECWLHPARYRTQPCKDGRNCKRRVCFFAHTNEQLRFLPGAVQFVNSSPRAGLQSTLKPPMGGSYDGSPLRQALAGSLDSSLAFESLNCLGHNGFLDGGFDGHLGSPRSGHLNFIGKPAHGFSHISSPTSTLVGHSHSPPPLSPPLSPSVSPPMSPDSPSNYTALARSLSCLSASNATLQQPFSGSSLQASLSQAALSHVQASLAACPPSIGSLSTATTRGPSPVSVATPAHHHLDRLHSLPSISIPSVEGREAVHIGSPMGISRETQGSQAMTDLIATLQELELRARAAEASRVSAQWSTKGQSLHHGPSSVPCTPTKPRWARQMDTWDVGGGETEAVMERVESGRDLRAKIYGRLGKENPLEHESPDIDWVNELLK